MLKNHVCESTVHIYHHRNSLNNPPIDTRILHPFRKHLGSLQESASSCTVPFDLPPLFPSAGRESNKTLLYPGGISMAQRVRCKVDVETRAKRGLRGKWSMGTYVKLAGRTARWRAETRWEEREGWERQKERKRGRKGAGAVERERGKRTAGLPGGETTPNVNTNYSPCASVASAAALHPTDWHCQSRRPFWINVDDGASSEHVIRNGLLQGPNLALPSIAMYENV